MKDLPFAEWPVDKFHYDDCTRILLALGANPRAKIQVTSSQA